jgi:hypothetical protein
MPFLLEYVRCTYTIRTIFVSMCLSIIIAVCVLLVFLCIGVCVVHRRQTHSFTVFNDEESSVSDVNAFPPFSDTRERDLKVHRA